MKRLSAGRLLLLAALLAACALAAIAFGAVTIPFAELFNEQNRQILLLRSARVLLAMMAGAGT